MAMGFVYVLVNPSMPELVKIGLTICTSRERANELHTTGVPTQFQVVHDELVIDCELIESRMHARFADSRVAKNREFFRMPVEDAVAALREVAAPLKLPLSALKNRCEIRPKLNRKFSKYIASGLTSVAVIQITDSDVIARFQLPTEPGEEPPDSPKQLIFLQTRKRLTAGEADFIEVQEDLSFISGIERDFPPDRDIKENAAAFVEHVNLATLLVIAESLFTPTGREEAIADYNQGLPSDLLAKPEMIDDPEKRER